MPELKRLPPPILELTAEEIHPVLKEVVSQVEAKATAQEALAALVGFWRDYTAIEDDMAKARRKKNTQTDIVLLSGQLMAVKASITRLLERHSYLAKPKR